MASSVETIEVTDPAHPLYGLTLPCLGVTVKPRLGRGCVVWLHPGVERLIPVAATSLAPVRPPVSRCRLSLPAATKVLAVLASLVPDCHAARQEDSHAPLATTHRHPDDEAPGPAAPPAPANGIVNLSGWRGEESVWECA